VGLNEPLSHSGYGITRYHLVTLGETDGFFGEVVEAGFHERSVRMVRDRAVDAAAIDSQVLAVELRDHPDLAASLVVVDALGPSTSQPVAVSRRFPPEFHDEVRDVLVGLHRDPAFRKGVLGRGMVEKFVSVGPEAYDDIRRMVDACEAVGFTEIR
jgi:phosphonate transport system substrate-binding protein